MNQKNEKRNIFLKDVSYIEHRINTENIRLKKLGTAQEYLTKLKESVDKCSELLSRSLEPGYEHEKFNNLIMESNRNYTKAYDSFEEHFEVVRKRVENLTAERENIISEYEKSVQEEKKD